MLLHTLRKRGLIAIIALGVTMQFSMAPTGVSDEGKRQFPEKPPKGHALYGTWRACNAKFLGKPGEGTGGWGNFPYGRGYGQEQIVIHEEGIMITIWILDEDFGPESAVYRWISFDAEKSRFLVRRDVGFEHPDFQNFLFTQPPEKVKWFFEPVEGWFRVKGDVLYLGLIHTQFERRWPVNRENKRAAARYERSNVRFLLGDLLCLTYISEILGDYKMRKLFGVPMEKEDD